MSFKKICYHLRRALPIASCLLLGSYSSVTAKTAPAKPAAGATATNVVKGEKSNRVSLENEVIKSQLLKKDFYDQLRYELPGNFNNLSPAQQKKTIKSVFLTYKYRSLGRLLWTRFKEVFLPPFLVLGLMIVFTIYCMRLKSRSRDLDKLVDHLPSGLADLYPSEFLFGKNKYESIVKTKLLHLFLFFITFFVSFPMMWDPIGYMTGTPTFLSLSPKGFLVLLLAFGFSLDFPLYVSPALMLAYIFFYNEKIITYLRFRILGDKFLIDDMESAELLYVQHKFRLPPELQTVIENRLFQARKYPERRPYIYAFVKNAVELPTPNEINAPVEQYYKNFELDLKGFEAYHDEVIDEFIEIYLKYKKSPKTYYYYFEGLPGVGKTSGIMMLAKKMGATIAIVSFAGATAEDILGTPPTANSPGKIGRLFEAIKKASPYGITPIILFIDEIDKALEGPHAKEIEDLCLILFERNNTTFTSRYLDGYKVRLPNIIIFAGNYRLSRYMRNRVKNVYFKEYTWETKERIIRTKMKEICTLIQVDFDSLSAADYKMIHNIIKQIKEESENPNTKVKYSGFREIERRVYKYLEKREMKKRGFHKKIKKGAT